MKLAVDFPSIVFREGPGAVTKLAREIERIGYDELDIFDHVVMGFPMEGRTGLQYPAKMPILEALVTLGFCAAVTSKIGLGTEVLVLPQRQPVLVAKQISTLDTLSGGRVRLGIGVGWQESEYDALGESFGDRGKRMDEGIRLLRTCWADERVDFAGDHYRVDAMGMEPKPPQGARLPIWIGGHSPAALRRVGQYGDGWLAALVNNKERVAAEMRTVREHAANFGRNASAIQYQTMLAPPPRENDDGKGRSFYADADRVARRAAEIAALGFGWVSLNATNIFQSGARTVDAMVDALGTLHDRLRREVG
ncbi:MAG TPA: LLM class F420-dependent oxidoreductase [Pseudomonadales bacterium]